MDIYNENNKEVEKLVKEIYEKLGYVDYPTIREILMLGIMFDQNIALGYIGRPIDALNYLKETNNVIKNLQKD